MALTDNLSMWCDLVSNATDQAGARTPTLVGSPTFPADYMKLDGGTDYVHYPSDAGITAGASDFSVVIWPYLDSAAGVSCFVSKYAASSPGQELSVLWNSGLGTVRFAARDASSGSGAVDTVTFGALSATTTYMVAAGWLQASNTMWISVNNTAVDTQPGPPGSIAGGTFRLELGESSQGLAAPMNGRLRSFGYWQRDIRSDLTTLYNGGTPLLYADITGGGGPPAALPFITRLGAQRLR
jgi:hypothetical protein